MENQWEDLYSVRKELGSVASTMSAPSGQQVHQFSFPLLVTHDRLSPVSSYSRRLLYSAPLPRRCPEIRQG
jgi:hypothetical protein